MGRPSPEEMVGLSDKDREMMRSNKPGEAQKSKPTPEEDRLTRERMLSDAELLKGKDFFGKRVDQANIVEGRLELSESQVYDARKEMAFERFKSELGGMDRDLPGRVGKLERNRRELNLSVHDIDDFEEIVRDLQAASNDLFRDAAREEDRRIYIGLVKKVSSAIERVEGGENPNISGLKRDVKDGTRRIR